MSDNVSVQNQENWTLVTNRKNQCDYCIINHEPREVYKSHCLYFGNGSAWCPKLRQIVCRICGKTGNRAHLEVHCQFKSLLQLKRFELKLKNMKMFCTFCIAGGQPPEIFNGHFLRSLSGALTCPILSKHKCPICGATGQLAHTKKFCPLA